MRLMNAFGDAAEHAVLSAMPGRLEARAAIEPGIDVAFPEDAPPLAGPPSPARLRRLARFFRGFDLVLSYNWGALDAVMARRLFGGPPLVHHEDGFNEDEADRLNPRRNLYRRIALPAAFAVVVPSERLERIARSSWHQPRWRVHRISNGIKVDRFSGPPVPGAIPGLERRPGEVVIGTAAGLRAVKNLPLLLRAVAAMEGASARLVIVGTGPEQPRIEAEARMLGWDDRLLMPGFLPDPARWIGHFDIFALSSDSEQFPISLVEAMAAGLPVAATDVGDVARMVSEENRPLIVPPRDERALAEALAGLVRDAGRRERLGQANRARAAAGFDEGAMIRAYADLYGAAIGRPDALSSGPSALPEAGKVL